MPDTRGSGQPWHISLNIDIFLLVLQNSIFHPFVASLVPVCLLAGSVPYNSVAVINTVVYAACVCLVWLLAPINERHAYGPRRPVSEDDEVVVITGGASGLGHALAQIYALKGVSTAVIDVNQPRDRVEGVEYYQCDVSDSTAAVKCLRMIENQVGPPTILINNAGIHSNRSLLETSSSEVRRVVAVNTLAQFDLAAAFVSNLVKTQRAGTLVTVSSVLGRLGAARLSSYTASKAALIAFHNSISAELRLGKHSDIKTILVTPGQLSTDMFAGIRQSALQRFFGPVVEVQQLAMSITTMVGRGRSGIIAEPAYARWIGMLDLLPVGLAAILREMAGVDTAMPVVMKETTK